MRTEAAALLFCSVLLQFANLGQQILNVPHFVVKLIRRVCGSVEFKKKKKENRTGNYQIEQVIDCLEWWCVYVEETTLNGGPIKISLNYYYKLPTQMTRSKNERPLYWIDR